MLYLELFAGKSRHDEIRSLAVYKVVDDEGDGDGLGMCGDEARGLAG